MKTQELKRQEAIARNAKHRPKYEDQCRREHPSATEQEIKAYADHKQGIPKTR